MNNRTRNSVYWYLVFVTFNLKFEYPFEKCEICDMKDSQSIWGNFKRERCHTNPKHQALIQGVVFKATYMYIVKSSFWIWRTSLWTAVLFIYFSTQPSLQLSTFAVVYVHIPMLSDSLCNGLGVSPSIRLSSNFAHAIIFRQKQLFLCNAWLPLSAVSWLMLDWCWLILFYDFAMISCQAYNMLQCKAYEM